MKHLTITICLTLTLLLGSAGMSWNADFQKGVTAYDSDDYATALREWTPLAKQGDNDTPPEFGGNPTRMVFDPVEWNSKER